MAHMLDPDGLAEQAKLVADAGSAGDLHRRLGGRVPADDVRRAGGGAARGAAGRRRGRHARAQQPRRWRSPTRRAAVAEGATLVDTSLAGLGAGAGNCQTEVLVAVLERMGIATGIDLWTLQDVADRIVRGEVMQRPIEIDRLTATMGYAVRARQLPAARDPGGRAVRARPARPHRGARPAARRRSARRTRSSGSPPRWRREPRPADDHGRAGRRPDRHAGDGRRADRARLGGRRGGRGGARRRPLRAPADEQPRPPGRRGRGGDRVRGARGAGGVSDGAAAAARRQHAARPRVRGVRRGARRRSARPTRRCRCCWCRRSRPPAASRSAASTCSSATARGCRSHATEYATDGALGVRATRGSLSGPTSAPADGSRPPTRSRSRSRACGPTAAARDPRRAGGARTGAGGPPRSCRTPRRPTTSRRSPPASATPRPTVPVLARCAPGVRGDPDRHRRDGARRRRRRPGAACSSLCGSFVPTTTAQLQRARARLAGAGRWWPTCARSPATMPPPRPSGSRPPRPRSLAGRGPAIVATPRERDPALVDARQPAARRAGAGAGRAARRRADVVRRQGRHHLRRHGARRARCAHRAGGRPDRDRRGALAAPATAPAYCVVPGNVGGPSLLVEVVAAILAAAPGSVA